MRTRRKDASLRKLVDPQYLSVVKSPANQTGFKVIRNDQGATEVVKANTPTRVRKKISRSDSMLLSIDLPEGVDESSADKVRELFGMTADYEIVQNGEMYTLKRKGSDDSTKTVPIDFGDGMVANVAADEFIKRGDTSKKQDHPGVRLVRIDFNEKQFDTVDAVREWLGRYEIDFKEGGVERIGDGFSVTRHDTDADAKRIDIAEGVTGVIVRSSETDVPIMVYRSVVDQAYGNWGWGHIDFAAALADPEFSEKSWDALYALRDVLENIIFYSGMSLEERKRLIEYACSQYAAFMTGLIDALPTDVIEQVKNSDRNILKQETSDMSKKDENTKVEDQTTKTDGNKAESITREDVQGMIDESLKTALPQAVEAGVTAAFEKITKRDDDKGEGENADGEQDGNKPVLEAIQALGQRMDKFEENVTAVRKDLDDALDETDVTRSDDDDEGKNDDKSTKRSDSVFGGMFSHLGVGQQ